MHGGPLWLDVLLTIFLSVLASTGFWGFIGKRQDRTDAEHRLLAGLAHDRLIHVGKSYIRRGWITYDEYDDFIKYLYNPYHAYGGNGGAERIAEEVKKLPIRESGTERKVST